MRTPLYDAHVRLQARIVDFHGWDLPVWYTGIKEEHLAVRNTVGIFDVSHMGEIWISGDSTLAYLDQVVTIEVAALSPGQAKYTFLLNEQGGIIDDLLLYCVNPGNRYMLCVNSSNQEKDYAWLKEQAIPGVEISDRSPETAMLALQGPAAARILTDTLAFDLDQLRYFHFLQQETRHGMLMISRTGYTGSDGVEIFLDVRHAESLWDAFSAAGAIPCGLGARDTLRLEMGYPLHGNDIDETTTPLEAGLDFAVDMRKPAFLGKDRLHDQLRQGLSRRLTGLILLDKGVPRQGYTCAQETRTVGVITSGSMSPVLNTGIALAYLDADVPEGAEIDCVIRSKPVKARVVKPPFVKTALHK